MAIKYSLGKAAGGVIPHFLPLHNPTGHKMQDPPKRLHKQIPPLRQAYDLFYKSGPNPAF